MKKLIYSSLILGSAFALASCSADEPGMKKNDGPVTFTVQLPGELATRFADGSKVDQLYYTVFSLDGEALDNGTLEWANPAAPLQVTLDMIPSQEYNLVFFACNSTITSTISAEAPTFTTAYGYNPATADFQINYTEVAINNEAYDAFYAMVPKVSTATNTDEAIQLKRPFAQINIGTNDLGKNIVTNYGLANYSTTLNIMPDQLASGMSLLNGTYTAATAMEGSEYAVSKTVNGLTKLADEFPVENYDYLDMIYLLVNDGGDQALLNAEFNVNIKDSNDPIQTIDLSSMPAKTNYQTNVYGALLTQSKDFNVAISAGFDGIANVDAWDGETYTDIDLNQAEIHLNSAADLAGFVKKVSNRGSEFHLPSPVYLDTDVDFKNQPIEGLGIKQVYDLKFYGNNHYIYNLNINNTNSYVGLIPVIVDGSVQDLNFVGADVTGARAGVLCGNAQYIQLTNVNVNNCKVSGDKKVAAVIGYCQESSLVTYKNVNAKNCTITAANGQAGAMTGYVSYATFTNCSATDCTITAGVQDNNFTGYGSSCFVGVMGTNRTPTTAHPDWFNSLTFTGCTITGCTLNYSGTDAAMKDAFSAAASKLWGGSSNATGTITVDGTVEYTK